MFWSSVSSNGKASTISRMSWPSLRFSLASTAFQKKALVSAGECVAAKSANQAGAFSGSANSLCALPPFLE